MSNKKLFLLLIVGAIAYGLITRTVTGQTGTPFAKPLG